ncbi:hypothetical protein NU688_27620 [Variovorax sp. ZS18.2.2]|uniref:hypothetical protein n=1 Tax=Variovorax sp. ZS18.2.2 TaxID=2971255 RepID=UPI0021514A22|nr:hypothetical protein [Variovorax sp. ZS18.2.2]MCR6479953.1 hypothetical protein [Variovorax sp. ZS18.2.2]
MAAPSSSHERAQRLPRDFAWLTVLIHAALFVSSTLVQLVPMLIASETVRSLYARPGMWIPMLSHAAMAWLLAAALAWSHARNALEERGAGSLARILNPGSRFALAYLVVQVVNIFALSPLLYRLQQLLFMPGGSLQEPSDIHAMRSWTVLIWPTIQLAVLVLGVWCAAWFALRKGGRVVPAMAPPDAAANDAEIAITTSPRRAVALLVAAVFASLQTWSVVIASQWTDAVRLMNDTALVLGWVVLPPVAFALAFFGGWLGWGPVSRGPALSAPWRRLSRPSCSCR